MKKIDRLFQIVEYLKARHRVVRAEDLAQHFSVSVRTIYRDINDLTLSGIPIIGEVGVGYMLDRDHLVKPLMFTLDEVEALALGAQMVKSYSDKELESSITTAMNRLLSCFPKPLQEEYENTYLLARNINKLEFEENNQFFSQVKRSIRTKQKLKLEYESLSHQTSYRVIRPLSMVFFGQAWVVLGWCEKRHDFRTFRLDRIKSLEILSLKFRDEKGKSFVDYCKRNGYSLSTG